MNERYFKNKNSKKSYDLNELINSGPIFSNDWVWKYGFSDWKRAIDVEELKEYVSFRPPEKKAKVLFKKILKSIIPSLIGIVLFSLIIGAAGGLIEKHQYNTFIEEVQPNIDEYFRLEEERYRREQARKLEVERQKYQFEQLKKDLEYNYQREYNQLERLRENAYNNFLSARTSSFRDFYIDLANKYLEKRERLYDSFQSELKSLELSRPQNFEVDNSSSLNFGSYDIPINTIYATGSSGRKFTRWKIYRGVGNHEQISYDKSHMFLFRPYKALFSTVNLSSTEIENNSILLLNFFFSALISNLLFLPIIVFGAMKIKKSI